MKNYWLSLVCLCVFISTLAFAASQATPSRRTQKTAEDVGQHWPQWRGPHGNGVSDAKNLPTTWSLEKNIVWKTPLPSWSGGTPVIWGDRVFVTSPSQSDAGNAEAQTSSRPPQPPGGGFGLGRGGGRPGFGGGGFGGGFGGGGFGGGFGARRDPGGSTLLLICIAKKDGKILWQRKLDEGNRIWMKQNASSPSPVTDGKHVWAVTGTGAVTAFDMNGKEIWKRNLNDYGRIALNWGYASSPLLLDGKLIIQVLHGFNPDCPSYLVAFNAATGKEVWRVQRKTDAVRESPDAYTTPALLTYNGKRQIIISGADYVTGHDPETGKEIWRAGGLNPMKAFNYRIVASPIVAGGMIYVPSRRRPLLALRPGGTGDVTTSHLVWKWDDNGAPDVPTPVSDGKYFYMVEDRGMVTCLDAKTGKLIWGPERTALGTVSASPLLADGKLYITNENAVTTVLAAGPKFKVLATNELDGSFTLSSIAVSGEQLFLRTSTHLYCIGKKAAPSP
jgi:outer membrane protein assembly factor BamB